MDPMTKAMREIHQMDELAAMDSPVHRRHPLAKLLVTVIYIFTAASYSRYDLTGLVPMMFYPILVSAVSGISIRLCLYKFRFILPIVCAVGIWNPFLDRTEALVLGNFIITGGMISFATLMLKGIFALTASFFLISTTNIEKICHALRLLHLPEFLAVQVLMTYRYISLLLTEAGTMMNAYMLRAPGQKGIHFSAWGSFAGQLLLRSMDRAQELYQSMKMRGFHGMFYYADVEPFCMKDAVYLISWTAVFAYVRFFDMSELIGGLFF